MIDLANGKFSPKALDFFENSDARLNILHGSVRSSKTVNCTIRWITYLFDGPAGDLFMVGKTRATLQRNVMNDLFDIVGEKNYRWVNRQEGELTIFHRRVYLVGANTEEAESKIRGATAAGAYCDEANLYPESFWAQLMARMSVPGAQCFCSLNPDSPYHWFYLNVLMNSNILNKKVWHFTLEDNPNLDPEYMESIKQMYSGVFYRRYILGEWCVAEGAIYDMFSTEKNVKALDETIKIRKKIVSCDYATSTVMSWSLIYRHGFNRYHKQREYYYDAEKEKRQKTDGEFGQDFKKWLNGERPDVIYCDPSAASWKAELRKLGYIVRDADNDVINGIRVVGAALESGRYTIDPSCKNTISEYPAYSWDPKAQKIGEDKPLKVNDHACDSDRYAIYTESKTALSGVY
jgi:PBSX family phage terminase large subunit